MGTEKLNHFRAATIRQFAFLENELDFRVTFEPVSVVEYQSPMVTLRVVYDFNRSYELDLYFQKIGQFHSFSFGEIVRAIGVETNMKIDSPSLPNEGVLERYLRAFAELLKSHCTQILEGNEFLFAKLNTQRKKECESYALANELRYARVEAMAAWERKDLSRFVRILEPLIEHLTKSELKKIEYAKKHNQPS